MKTIEETKQWLLENRVDGDGNLDLSELDFSDFNGDIYIGNMKVKGSLYQSYQEVQGSLIQSYQQVQRTLKQNCQEVQGDLYQGCQEVQGEFITQKLQKDEKYKIDECGDNCIVKKVKKEKGN